MKAVVQREYGPPDVLRLQEVATPTPKRKEVLVRIHATSVNFGDMLVRNFRAVSPRSFHMPFVFWLFGKAYFGFRKPRRTVLGSEFSGEIVAVGEDVKRFRPGEQVFGYRGPEMGTYAEYLCMPEDGVIAPKPANMTHAEAASVPYGAIMALTVLRRADIQPGQRVLVNGASGGIGPAVVQLAKNHFRAEVTGVGSTAKLPYMRSLGADRVIDYTKEDFADGPAAYDVIIDILGKISLARCRRALKPHGRCIFVSFKGRQLAQMLWTSMFGDKKVICTVSHESAEDLRFIKELIEAGTFKAVIDRSYPLEQAADAHRYVDSGRKQGAVVMTLQ